MRAREEAVIWAAGFFDGEGCISIQRQERYGRVYFYMGVSLYQNDRRPLEELVSLFGGTIGPEGIAQKWRAGGPTAAAALDDMLPYLRVKREQAVVAIEFQGRRFAVGQKRPDGFSTEDDERDYMLAKNLKRGWLK